MSNLFLEEYDVDEIKSTDIMLIRLDGKKLTKKSWIKSRGLRQQQLYLDHTGEIRAREIYNYQYTNGGREVESYSRALEWFDNGSLICSEITTPELTFFHLKEVNKSARNGQIDYLEAAAENLKLAAANMALPLTQTQRDGYALIGNSIDLIMSHYNEQIFKYTTRNTHTMDFENAVLAEADANILQRFPLPARPADDYFPNGLTVLQSIMFQLKGVTP